MHLNLKPTSPELSRPTWFKLGSFCVGFIGLSVVTFLSLRTSPAISTVAWVPRPVAHWADQHGRFRNFPAYAVMGLPFFMTASAPRRRLRVFLMLSLLIAGLEMVQLAIPSRVCDFRDFFWGCAGLATGWVVSEWWHRGGSKTRLVPVPSP